jgi:putative ABC transport system permease protein
LSIRDNAGFRTFESESFQLDALALVLPAFFFLIAALVSMTAMTRLVDAERTTIAIFKALGYRNRAISCRYLLYALSATTIGSILGVALGYGILPPMIFNAFRTLFNIPHEIHPFSAQYTVISAMVAVFSTVFPAMLVVRSSVRETPSQAMRPLAPKAGRRIVLEYIRPLWKNLSFLQKVTARNLFRYKKRLLMTVFGVAGCTGLIFTALGLHDALGTLTQKQFGQVFKSDVTIDFKLQDDEGLDDFISMVEACPDVYDTTVVYQRSMRIYSPDLTKDISLIVAFCPDELPDFITMSSRSLVFSGSRQYRLTDDGVILTEQIARQFGVEVGEVVNLRTLEGDTASFTIIGIVENYTMHYCYMTAKTFETAYGIVPAPNRMLAVSVSGQGELPQSLLRNTSVRSVMYTTNMAADVASQLDVLTFVVVILIVSAGILIFVVLFSLNTINLEERRRELASIKVLGFFNRELASYIYRENVILTVVGAVTGIGLGFLLQRYIITTLEIDMFMFSRDILWTSFAVALALTFVFATGVNLIMYRPLTRINMVEALKAVE